MCDHLTQVLSCKSLIGVWAGKPQKLVNDNGVPRGHEKVLGKKQRRGLTICELYCNIIMISLQKKKTGEDYLVKRGHIVLFIPKFHCELNPIERVWGQAKVQS